jgi:adenylate kinase family enzyme
MYGTVYIMMGLPGSGKSTKAKKLALGNDFIFSTDNYWIRPDGYYDFNASR